MICWDIGRKSIKVNDTDKQYKKTASAEGVQVNVFCIRYMPGISVVPRAEADERKLF